MQRYEVRELLGKVCKSVKAGEDEVTFELDNGEKYKLYHEQNCCEHVEIKDICGDLNDLIDSPLTMAEESSDHENTNDYESATWTFYKFATVQGYVTISWLGVSNGYYSERVDFVKL